MNESPPLARFFVSVSPVAVGCRQLGGPSDESGGGLTNKAAPAAHIMKEAGSVAIARSLPS